MNSHEKQLMLEVPLMKCANKTEFRQRLQWLSEGMLCNHMNNIWPFTPNQAEIEQFQKYKESLMTAAELMLGITKKQIASMQKKIDALEQENDAIALTRIRHAVSQRLVEIRLLLRDGNLNKLNGFP